MQQNPPSQLPELQLPLEPFPEQDAPLFATHEPGLPLQTYVAWQSPLLVQLVAQAVLPLIHCE
jgi:hypothetical protein